MEAGEDESELEIAELTRAQLHRRLDVAAQQEEARGHLVLCFDISENPFNITAERHLSVEKSFERNRWASRCWLHGTWSADCYRGPGIFRVRLVRVGMLSSPSPRASIAPRKGRRRRAEADAERRLG